MRVDWAFMGNALIGHDALIDCYAEGEFDSPTRSTIPLIEYWRSPEERVLELSMALAAVAPPWVRLDFEHTVTSPRGRGKASHTDVMMTSREWVMAIEAKWTEPRYEEVGDWLGDSTNKAEVLRGWCDLLERRATGQIDERELYALPYQMVHRAASACHAAGVEQNCWLIYLTFEVTAGLCEKYLTDLRDLHKVLEPRSSLGIALAECSICQLPAFDRLRTRWEHGERKLGKLVCASLQGGRLLNVSLDRVHHIK